MKKFLSLVLALVMAMSLVTVSAGAKDFTDSDSISGDEYAEAIDVMSALEIIDGYEGGAFQPQGTLTRGAAAKIIACMMLGKTTAESLGNQAAPFKDVPVGSTFAGYIAYCVEAGIIDGYADGTFRPSNKLTGFAFLKMLLTAMGYDSSVEGFTGTNWTVNVARRAIENGLTDGNDDFVGTDLATREEACLYAVNTIKATLVEYEYKGSSVTINGVEISQGASAPKVVTSVNASQATSINSTPYSTGATGQTTTYTVEFGEKYMPKLSLKGDTDAFERPVHVWDYKGVKIGTYTDEADLEYNKKVASDTIYDELGLTSAVEATVYMDGVVVDHDANTNGIQGFTVQNNNTSKTGDTGILTQVWKSGHWAVNGQGQSTGVWVTDVKITQMHYYVGDVVSKTAATKNKDAYVTVVARGEKNYPAGTFTTEDFAVDDVVIYNYSNKANETGVKYLTVAETAVGTLTAFTTGDSATVGGTKYDYSCTVAREAAQASVNTDVTVVLDPFGYAIDIDGKTDDNYAVVLGVNDPGDLRLEAKLLFADGKVELVSTAQDYANVVSEGDIVSYTIKSSDRYALTKRADSATVPVAIENGDYEFTYNGGSRYANGKTIFLVKTVDADGNAIYNAYEGIKNVPDITKTDAVKYAAVYCKNNDATLPATVVYVDASNAVVLNPASDVVFVKGNDDGVSFTYGIGSYWKFDAVVNGELKEDFMVTPTADKYGLRKDVYGLYDGVYYDANGVATLYASGNVITGTGVYRQANDVLGTVVKTDLTGNPVEYAYYSVASNCYMVLVNEDGDFQTGLTASAAVKDTNDKVFFKLNSSREIASVYVVKVDGGEVDATAYNVAASDAVEFLVPGGTGYTASLSGIAANTLVTVRAKTANMVIESNEVVLTEVTAPANGVQGVYTFVMPAKHVSANAFVARPKAANTNVTLGAVAINDADTSGAFTGVAALNPSGEIYVTVTGTPTSGDSLTLALSAADSNATVNKASVTLNYTSSWSTDTVTVTAENGTTKQYTVKAGAALSSDTTLNTTQNAGSVTGTGNGTATVTVDNTAKTLTVTFQAGVTDFALGDKFTINLATNNGATAAPTQINLLATSATSFVSDTASFTVTAQNGAVATYKVIVGAVAPHA